MAGPAAVARILRFSDYRQGDPVVYPMLGFYLLHVPIGQPSNWFTQAFVSSHVVVLADRGMAIVVPVNYRGARLLLRQIQHARESRNPRYLAVMTSTRLDPPLMKYASVVRLRPLKDLDRWFDTRTARILTAQIRPIHI